MDGGARRLFVHRNRGRQGVAQILAVGVDDPRIGIDDAFLRDNDIIKGAMNLIDPLKREEHALTDVELARYEQVQISHYRDIGASQDMEAGTAVRDIEIGVVNKHTMTERTVRYREQWRWDEPSKNWWLTSGMPDLWDGE